MNPLDQLEPLIEPAAISWWPPAPGWWLLAALLPVLLWSAWRLAPYFICWRQLMPAATTIVSSSASRTAGSKRRSAIRMEIT